MSPDDQCACLYAHVLFSCCYDVVCVAVDDNDDDNVGDDDDNHDDVGDDKQ